jgi:ABC-type transport system involved in multi-copper enzyme maturation permease subunit
LWATAKLTFSSLLMLGLAVIIAGVKTRRVWQEGPPSAMQLWWEKIFCTPILWISLLRRWMRHKLERNPIGWLEQRTWSGRLVTWGWFAVIISIYSAVFTDRNLFRGFDGLQLMMAWLMAGSITASAAGSFRRERQTGVLELLLVSPLTTRQIIFGRLRGLWGQFLPAIAILLGIWLYFASLFHTSYRDVGTVWYFATTFLTLPVVGLYFSLRCRNFIAAFLLTVVWGVLAVPMAIRLAAMLWWMFSLGELDLGDYFASSVFLTPLVTLGQLATAWLFNVALQRRLESRSFPLERGVT